MCSTMEGMDAALAPLAERVAPVTLAVERRIPGPDALLPVLPEGGLQRGWSVAVEGSGSWSLAAALVAPLQVGDGWVGVVGAPAFGLVAATGYGFRLDRVALVDQPPTGRWAAVVAALVDGFDAVLVDPAGGVPARDARRLRARARERGAILVHLDGARTWPEAADVVLRVEESRWEGLEEAGPDGAPSPGGHGHLRARRVAVTGSGRRLPGRPRRTEVWLPGPGGGLVATDPASTPVGRVPPVASTTGASTTGAARRRSRFGPGPVREPGGTSVPAAPDRSLVDREPLERAAG
jgi:hypothetical protein